MMPPRARHEDPTRWLGAVHVKAFPGAHVSFCRFASEVGFGWVELKYEPWLDEQAGLMASASKVRGYAGEHGITLSVHAAYDHGLNIAAADDDARQEALRACHASLEYAARIGAEYLTVHGGHVDRGGPIGDDSTPIAARAKSETTSYPPPALVDRSVAALEKLARRAGDVGVLISVENRHQFTHDKRRFPVTPTELRDCLDALPRGVMCTIDSGHANSIPGTTLLDFVRLVGPERVALTHLHDNLGNADSHLLPGEGTVAFQPFVEAWLDERWQFPLAFEVLREQHFVEARKRVMGWLQLGH